MASNSFTRALQDLIFFSSSNSKMSYTLNVPDVRGPFFYQSFTATDRYGNTVVEHPVYVQTEFDSPRFTKTGTELYLDKQNDAAKALLKKHNSGITVL